MDLFELASTYSSFGNHRTGSKAQLATEAWLSSYLNGIANQVEYFEFDYLHFNAVSEIKQNGREIASIPLYYESVNEMVHCKNVEVALVEVDFEEHSAYQNIQSLVRRARDKQADALVVATKCESNSLYALNVSPELKNSLPVILVPGSEYQNISRGNLTLKYSANVDHRQARNVVC